MATAQLIPVPKPSSVQSKVSILCVDDEAQVLEGLSLALGRRYEVFTARSGMDGLSVLSKHPEIQVVLADMRMPLMDGAGFLMRAKEVAPETVRMLLTGHADLDSAIAAVNEGNVFRILTKPCSQVALLVAMQSAVAQRRLIAAERVLLERTLRGVVALLTDVLAMASPASFGRASRIKVLAQELATALQAPSPWHIEVAAMVSQLGFIALPAETAERAYSGGPLSSAEADAIARVPATTEKLLANIPRLEVVQRILAASERPYLSFAADGHDDDAETVRVGAQILRVAIDFDHHVSETASPTSATSRMRARASNYDPEVIDALLKLKSGGDPASPRRVSVDELEAGMVFADDVRSASGALLAARGLDVTPSIIERLRLLGSSAVSESVLVYGPEPDDRTVDA
jgi:response regulator RpfG family c-di-GMP phosphodiesterase